MTATANGCTEIVKLLLELKAEEHHQVNSAPKTAVFNLWSRGICSGANEIYTKCPFTNFNQEWSAQARSRGSPWTRS